MEHFTDRCRKVFAVANQEAIRRNHEHIDSEHVLLGLVKEGTGVGATVLKNFVGDLDKVKEEVESLIASADSVDKQGNTPRVPMAKKVLESAIEEARSMDHRYIGTEHILLGFLHQPDCIAAKTLTNLGLSLSQLREGVHDLLGDGK